MVGAAAEIAVIRRLFKLGDERIGTALPMVQDSGRYVYRHHFAPRGVWFTTLGWMTGVALGIPTRKDVNIGNARNNSPAIESSPDDVTPPFTFYTNTYYIAGSS